MTKTKNELQIEKEVGEIKEAIVSKDYDKAKQLLGEYINEELTKEERGEIYTQLILLYVDTVNETNETYRKSLELALAATKKLQSEEIKAEDKLKSLVIKQKLQEIDDLD